MENLAAGLKQGNKRAFVLLFDSKYAKVYNFCYSFLRLKQEAEEVTQDVFVKIWVIREDIDPNKSLDGLLFRIAKNLTLNRIRDNKRLKENLELQDDMKSENSVMEHILCNEMEDIIQKGIQELPTKRKLIFELSRFNGLTNKEIGQKLNLSINTVEGQMRKAIKQLHDHTSKILD